MDQTPEERRGRRVDAMQTGQGASNERHAVASDPVEAGFAVAHEPAEAGPLPNAEDGHRELAHGPISSKHYTSKDRLLSV
jgi:hypothetical protein